MKEFEEEFEENDDLETDFLDDEDEE